MEFSPSVRRTSERDVMLANAVLPLPHVKCYASEYKTVFFKWSRETHRMEAIVNTYAFGHEVAVSLRISLSKLLSLLRERFATRAMDVGLPWAR